MAKTVEVARSTGRRKAVSSDRYVLDILDKHPRVSKGKLRAIVFFTVTTIIIISCATSANAHNFLGFLDEM